MSFSTVSNDNDDELNLTRHIHLSNTFFSSLRESYGLIIDAPIRLTDLLVKKKFINCKLKRSIESKQNDKTFVKIKSNWTFEQKNLHQGFNSLTIWLRNPSNERFLIKFHSNPFTAVNEWLAYSIGKLIDLPVNQVQISVYENNLVTLHKDIKNDDNEEILSFNQVPKLMQKKLLESSLFGSMDLFDKFFLNLDRNPTNILIKFSKGKSIEEDFQIYFIDHSSSFGMGKYSLVSTIANKSNSKHLQIKKFHPNKQTKRFEKYLLNLPEVDRYAIRKTLNLFSQITTEQIDGLFEQIRFLLTENQFQRIHQLIILQRDLIRFYAIQWGLFETISFF